MSLGSCSSSDATRQSWIAFNSAVERGFGVLYQVTIEVKALMQIVLSRRRKARLYLGIYKQVELFIELAFEYFHAGHILFIVLWLQI